MTLLFFIPLKAISAFNDLPNDPLYKNYLENFEAAHVIVGDTQGGKPTGTLRPNDFIQRDEFTKVAVLMSLLEQKEQEGLASEYQGLSLDSFTLKIAQLLKPYYKVINGSKPFSDIEQKDDACASNPSGCQPWYTEYINYASSQGMIKGYTDNTFRPGLPILRIYALKLIMAENGNIPASQDVKFKKLASDPRIQKVILPKCLEGAEPFILNANGGNTPDSKNLLAYALLADKLDLFGSDCQLFAEFHATTPEQRAAALQQPLTRKEIARYYALTTDYSVLMDDPATDPTTSTAEENGMTYFDPKAPEGNQDEDVAVNDDQDEEVGDDTKEIMEDAKKLPKNPSKRQMVQNPSASQMSIEALAAKSQTGRCCTSMDLGATCKLIHFEDYVISETPMYNYNTYQGATWYLAQRKGESCYIPFGDILGEGNESELKKVEVANGFIGPITPDQNKRRLEINKNLDQCVLSGKTIKACRDMGLTHKTEGSFEYNEVLAWYQSTLAIKSRIDTNLTNLYVISQGLTLEEAKAEGVKGKENKPVERYFVNQWYIALKPIRDGIYINLDSHLNQGFTLEETRKWGLSGKSKNDVKYAFVEGWYNEKRQIEDEKLLRDEKRGPEFWEGEVWSPYDDWMSPGVAKSVRETKFFDFVTKNKQYFVDAANIPKVKGKVSPPLIAAIMWDEMIGSGYNGSSGYTMYDYYDEINRSVISAWEGRSYGPFQIDVGTFFDIIDAGYAPKPQGYDSFFKNSDANKAYIDKNGDAIERNGFYLTEIEKEQVEVLLGRFQIAVELGAGRLAQIVDFWNRPGGSDLTYADDILGTLYSQGFGHPKQNPQSIHRGDEIARVSRELNEKVFNNTYEQRQSVPITE